MLTEAERVKGLDEALKAIVTDPDTMASVRHVIAQSEMPIELAEYYSRVLSLHPRGLLTVDEIHSYDVDLHILADRQRFSLYPLERLSVNLEEQGWLEPFLEGGVVFADFNKVKSNSPLGKWDFLASQYTAGPFQWQTGDTIRQRLDTALGLAVPAPRRSMAEVPFIQCTGAALGGL